MKLGTSQLFKLTKFGTFTQQNFLTLFLNLQTVKENTSFVSRFLHCFLNVILLDLAPKGLV